MKHGINLKDSYGKFIAPEIGEGFSQYLTLWFHECVNYITSNQCFHNAQTFLGPCEPPQKKIVFSGISLKTFSGISAKSVFF